MGGLFGGGGSSSSEVYHGRTVRMPTETDTSVAESGRKTRAKALQRTGRASTIMTDSSKETVGVSGKKLG